MNSVLLGTAMTAAEVEFQDAGITVDDEIATVSGGYQLVCRNREDSGRDVVEAFIADRFQKAYEAEIKHFHPLLLSRESGGHITSAVGVRPGTQRPLFLEQYLDVHLEQAVEAATGVRVNRANLVEIGNLASSNRFASQSLFLMLTAALAEAGFNWVVFTATTQIREILERLDFRPVTLCAADPQRLPDRGADWGSYYDSAPLVQAGQVNHAMQVIGRDPVLNSWLPEHEVEGKRLSAALRRCAY